MLPRNPTTADEEIDQMAAADEPIEHAELILIAKLAAAAAGEPDLVPDDVADAAALVAFAGNLGIDLDAFDRVVNGRPHHFRIGWDAAEKALDVSLVFDDDEGAA